MEPVLDASRIRAAEAFTIEHDGIASIDLMERAAHGCARFLLESVATGRFGPSDTVAFHVVAGMGNNGGDGLAIARLLHQRSLPCRVTRYRHRAKPSPENELNLIRLVALGVPVVEIGEGDPLPAFDKSEVVVDALFGTGLSAPLSGGAADLVRAMNAVGAPIVSIDVPSGLPVTGELLPGAVVARACCTLAFEVPREAFFFAETGVYVGHWEVIPIGLNTAFLKASPTERWLLERADIVAIRPQRHRFDHKGNHGHALMIAGSAGLGGAAILAVQAALRSGVGLVSGGLPAAFSGSLAAAAPSAMSLVQEQFIQVGRLAVDTSRFSAIGIGPGLGRGEYARMIISELLRLDSSPMVIDADALNLIAEESVLRSRLAERMLLTPHPREMDRLLGSPSKGGRERLLRTLDYAKQTGCHIVLKGAYTAICTPAGRVYFNSTGNPGMAKGGSGDVLTGLLTGLLAQGLPVLQAAQLGVYLHGLAGDWASERLGQEAMHAGDLIDELPHAWRSLQAAAC